MEVVVSAIIQDLGCAESVSLSQRMAEVEKLKMYKFDVFLCHNSQDKPEVREFARQLQQRGLKPWLDEWELRPGVSWQELLEEQIDDIKSAAVLVGSSGLGPWQKREMRAFLSEFVDRGCPVIPVLLGNAPQKLRMPFFLKAITWVDFRNAQSNPMGRLIWAITGIKPVDFDSPRSFVSESPEELKPDTSPTQYFTADLGNGVTLELVAIPGGTFQMGSPKSEGHSNEKPQHEVTIQSFFMGIYPITQKQYEQVMGVNPSFFKPSFFKLFFFKDDNRPVEQVSWYDAVHFCQKLSKQTGKEYRLPSEAEWEYACRAGTTTPYYFGGTIRAKLGNYDNNVGETTSVEQYPPNAFGLYDMHGNVWEWCEDDWHDNYEGAPNDGSAWLDRKNDNRSPLRGGSWVIAPDGCRSAFRSDGRRNDRYGAVGFRVVCDVGRTP